jgi:NhaC family Na+:H+ antiporter
MAICVLGQVGLQVPLLLSWFVIFIFARLKKMPYEGIEIAALNTIRSGFQAVMILITVGALIGSWIASGTVQTLIYYGLCIIHPSFFLVTALIFCSIISLATGTSYGTVGTGGLAMMGVGMGLGIPPALTAGAVISGSLFGDKMSPFSDTTNLASAMAGSNLFDHIKHMLFTTGPAYIITIIVYTILGFKYGSFHYDASSINEILIALKTQFHIHIVLLLPIIVVIFLLIKKVPSIPTILSGTLLGVIFSLIFQNLSLTHSLSILWKGYEIESGVVFIDKLLNRGGITSMTGIAIIMILAMGLGGMLEKAGILQAFLNLFIKKITSKGRLILSTVIVSYISNMIGSTQAFSHVMTGRILKPVYDNMGLDARNLSRTMEDAGTLGGVLIPWHTNAVFMVGVLGVPTLAYFPYAIFSWITPIIAIIYGYTGFFIMKKQSTLEVEE